MKRNIFKIALVALSILLLVGCNLLTDMFGDTSEEVGELALGGAGAIVV